MFPFNLLLFEILQHAVEIKLGRICFLFDKHGRLVHGHYPSQATDSLAHTRQVIEKLASTILITEYLKGQKLILFVELGPGCTKSR